MQQSDFLGRAQLLRQNILKQGSIQQHTAGFTENITWAPHLIRLALGVMLDRMMKTFVILFHQYFVFLLMTLNQGDYITYIEQNKNDNDVKMQDLLTEVQNSNQLQASRRLTLILILSEKEKKNITVEIAPIANRKIVESGLMKTVYTQIHDHLLYQLGT